MRSLKSAILGGVALATLAVAPALAGGTMFSGVRSSSDGAPSGSVGLFASNDSTTSIFDIAISLEADPQGDDDATVDDGANDDAQEPYEEAIREFADAVCQSTNTAHKLGVVRIFRNDAQKAESDVDWQVNCPSNKGPRAWPNSFGVRGKSITMCENWSGAGGDLLSNAEGSGFTLAHEWGHYALGLYDEYASGSSTRDYMPRSTDTASSPSIMNRQWCAASGYSCPSGFTNPDLDFLEFSTDQIAPFDAPLSASNTNAQYRVYGKSGWDTLIDSTDNDPKVASFPDRTRYTNLDAVKPPDSGGDFTVNDDEANCRDELDIRWMQEDIVLDILIDRSGSMSGTPIANAKTAANVLIDSLPEGTSAFGVSSFATNTSDDFPITEIPDPGTAVKDSGKAAVNGLTATGQTSLFDGLLDPSLAKVDAFVTGPNADRPKVVFVLSDGADNDSVSTANDVITAYNNSDVPIIAFGFGSGAPTSVLTSLANNTGGAFFQSPTTLAEIQSAFLSANAAVSSAVVLSNALVPASASATTTSTLSVDDTLDSVFLSVSFNGDPVDVDFTLLNPAGSDTGVNFDCTDSGVTVSCSARLDSAAIASNGTGDYQLEITNNTGADIDVAAIATAEPTSGDTFEVSVSLSGNGSVTSPEPALIKAIVNRDTAITGLVATANVFDSTGALVTTIDLLDDGENGDEIPGDGVYTGFFDYQSTGSFSVVVNVDNSAGTGSTTIDGELVATNSDGSAQDPTAAQDPVTASFTRSSSATLGVSGVIGDNHADDPAGGACTAVLDDNSDTAGKIDFAGDVDCFTFVPTDPSAALHVRSTAQMNGMDSVVTAFASDGTTVIASADSTTTTNATSGVIAEIDPADIDPAGVIVTVEHTDSSADSGSYQFSAGPELTSDSPAVLPDPGGDGGGGGAVGPLMLWLMALLGLGGLVARRRRLA